MYSNQTLKVFHPDAEHHQAEKYDIVYRRHLFLKKIKLFQIFKAFE